MLNEIKAEPASSENLPQQNGDFQNHEHNSLDQQNECHKIIEAKTAVILLKDSRQCTKNEYTQWLLKMLYQPCSRKDSEAMNVLYLSRNRRKIWATDFNINQDLSRADAKKNMNQLYVITPKTSIMTVAQENRLVYIIDLSSSLSTVADNRGDILLSKVFRTLKNSLEALVQPFSMQVAPHQKVIIQPLLKLTVMADCSQFASNVNVISMLVEHPTMRVFIQNVEITANNIHTIIKKLETEFSNFQESIVQFRKYMKTKRENMGYNLDVGNTVVPPNSVFNAAISKQSKKKPFSVDSTPVIDDSSTKPIQRSISDFDIVNKAKDTSFYSSKKEVWGIGKSGANLSRILHAGHFALKLLSRHGRAQLILITDGAMKSNVHDNTFVRQFAEEDITCHIIQIGNASGFIPGRNFGFVPDTEILQFLARATNGTFMHSDTCEFELKNLSEPKPKSYPIVQFVDFKKAKHIHTPNIFHRKFLFREVTLARYLHSELRLQADGDSQVRRELGGMDGSNDYLKERYNFPWDPYARGPEGDWRLLKYREYTLPSEFSHIIAARAREGFSLQSVSFDGSTGSKHLDPGIRSLEASDVSLVRKERIQIVMVMRWQPNIIIEYRIKATWLPTIIGNAPDTFTSEDILVSSNIFSRSKAPRAEIFVRTDLGFAHILQNWDMLKRRAQMMGVVTGSIYFGESYAAPVYSKVDKLKTYLGDIFESDEVLKTIIAFPNKFWSNINNGSETNATSVASSGRSQSNNTNITQHISSFIEAFKQVWERINHSETRARTRCWYDPGCIDLLVGDVSPFMTPKFSTAYNEEFVLNVEEDILAMLNHVKNVIAEWADFEAEDGTFIRIIHKLVSSNILNDEEPKDVITPSLGYPPSFCELRVRHEYGRLITLRLLFFNVEFNARQKIVEHLMHLLEQNQFTNASCNMMCKRPFSLMLMRDPLHFADVTTTNNEPNVKTVGNLTKNQSRAKAWYLPATMWLTSEYIVRDYLKHTTWNWQTDNYQDLYHREHKMMPIPDLAFQFLCQARLDQGYQLVSPRPDSAQFYQEITTLDHENNVSSICAIQYFIWKDSNTGKITTEIWMEPSNLGDQYELIKKWAFEPDRKTISQLVTFDQIHTIGRQKGVGDFKDKKLSIPLDVPDDDISIMLLPQLFDVASVLRSNKFVVASFQLPQYNMLLLSQPKHQQCQVKLKTPSSHIDEDTSDHSGNSTPITRNRQVHNSKPHRHIRRHAHPTIMEENTNNPVILENNQKIFSIKPDALLSKNKETIAKLDTVLQNYTLLHYFIERSLNEIASGEILMSHHDVGSEFWQELRNALQSIEKDGKHSSTSLIPDLRKARCFVKIFDSRSFVLILFPSLESVSNGLLKLQEDDRSKAVSTIEQCRFLDIFMFECVRKKPMKPTKSEFLFSTPVKINNHIHLDNIIEQPNTISIKHVDHLIHESDGLGVMLRPSLYEGQYSSCQTHAQLTDRILRVAQDISKYYSSSFLKSFYSCLMRGFMINDDDLNKVLEVCNESLMEIDITEFVNTMTMQKHECSESNDVHELVIQGKFNTIFHQYFELVQTKNKSISNLFYYKPPFSRNVTYQENLSQDEKISYIIDLVAYSESPLLLRLNVAYKTLSTTLDRTISEHVVPVTCLPTSYSEQVTNGKKFDLEEAVSQLDTFPIGPLNKKVYLQIVCLNMSHTPIDEYRLLDELSPYHASSTSASLEPEPECFSSLSQDQKVALTKIDLHLNWLLKEETIHGLLKTPTITLSILQYVVNQLNSPCPFVDYETSIKMPFNFVKNFHESRLIFIDELEKDSKASNKYLLKRVGEYFYVSEDTLFNMGEEASYSNNQSPIITESIHSTNDHENITITRPTDDEFCDGLGISLTKFSEKEDLLELEKYESDTPLDKRPLYWLILIPFERYIQIYFYTKLPIASARDDILNPIKEKIKVIEERTNRLSLLNYLQDTRICSKYLQVPNDPNAICSDEEDSEDETLSEEVQDVFANSDTQESVKFIAGQFACPIVYKKRFPLHWRLQPNVALKFLTTDVLRLFTVINRPNMFVIERDGSIVYCKIYEENLEVEMDDSPRTTYGSPVQTLNMRNTEDDTQTLVENTPGKRELSKSAASPRGRMTNGARVSTNEKRELVLEVYGVNLPTWVEVEFVNMIENRLISQITLNEIQQFFARNTTSKPTAADVDFILPTWKPFTQREMFRVPNLVNNPYTLMQYFRQSLIADNIRPLFGPYVTNAIKNYYNNIFFTQESDALQNIFKPESSSQPQKTYDIPPGSFCFYYNCIKRLPGISTSLELSAGQGMAGICLTLLDEVGMPITKVNGDVICSKNFDPEVIHHCLEEEFREVKIDATYYHIWVDIWVIGAVDSNALAQHIYECYRQSLCDYFIEKTVTIDLGAALSLDGALQKAVSSKKSEGRLGTVVRKKFIESVLFILKKASELKSPTVCSMDRSIRSNPWSMDDLIRYIDAELRKIEASLRPTVAWTNLSNDLWCKDDDLHNVNNNWDLYRGFQYRQRHKLQSNIRLVAISGLDEFVEKLGSVSDSLNFERRLSAASENDSQKGRSRRSSGESANTDGGNSQKKFRGEDQSRASSAFSSSGFLHRQKIDLKKHCFLILTLDVHQLSIYTYNWPESVSQELFNGLNRVLNRQESRNDIMTNIMHQKMGLFHHTPSIKSVIERFATSSDANDTRAMLSNMASSSFSISSQNIHHASPKGKIKTNNRQFEFVKSDSSSSSRTPGPTKKANTSNPNPYSVVNMLDLKDMIAFPITPARKQTDDESSREYQIDRILQKSIIRTTELDHALMDSLTDSVADTAKSKDFDILRRHGQPFLETFLRRTKIHSAHRKALKVYLKWRKRYGQPQVLGIDIPERLTRPEVATIMRSSRVLHFCRTPLIFCDPDKDWSYLPEDSGAREVVVDWFKEMARSLLSEYATYLESADMQLIDFAKCEDTHGNNDTLLKSSKFSLGKKMTTDCLPTFLLRVFEGGSIICEIRLTKVFVSVTLYTLHRQYGRLDYNRFKPETRTKKRASFKKFEENSGHFKQMIHINSFVYDFQLQYIQKMLNDSENIPADIDILAFIRRFALTNQQPSPYSKDRLVHGLYQFQVHDIDSASFFDNLFKNAHRHGFLNVLSSTGYSAVSVSSNDLSFQTKKYVSANWIYTLVLCPSETDVEEDTITIEYFVLVVYQGQTTPESMTKTSWVQADGTNLQDILLPEEGYTMADIVSQARSRLDIIVSEVIVNSKRVHDWSKLYSADALPNKDRPDLIRLMSEFDRIDITTVDKNLAKLFMMKLDWNDAFEVIKKMMKNSTKDFYEGGYRHLLLYNTRYMDYMIHLRIDAHHCILGWMVSREKRTNRTVFEGAEREQIINLGKTFYYHLWHVIAAKR